MVATQLLPVSPMKKDMNTAAILGRKHIDQLVYELYGLTDEEIRIVEEATK